jgi:hypothetical protein
MQLRGERGAESQRQRQLAGVVPGLPRSDSHRKIQLPIDIIEDHGVKEL